MKPTSKLFTISEAARELGYTSRSTLYRLIEKGCFNNYLWTDGKKKYLELNPKVRKSLAQIIATNIQWRSHALHVKN